jgi:hypothetical protein
MYPTLASMSTGLRSLRIAGVLAALLVLISTARSQPNEIIFDDALQTGWENWSWAELELANSAIVQSGSHSIRVTVDAWEALYLHHAPFAVSGFTNITFWIHGGTAGGQRLRLQAVFDSAAVADGQAIGPLEGGTWQQVQVPMSVLVPPGQTTLDGFWMQDQTGGAQPAFYIDEIRLIAGASPPPPTNQFVTVHVDPGAGRQVIRPEIYGVAFADEGALRELNVPLNRSGGNATTRYNWQANASNRGSDWYFESLASSSATPGADGDAFIAESRATGAEPMVTIPIIGWVARLGPNRARRCSFSIAKYGAQTDSDWQWYSDAGNGISAVTGNAITGNDPEDANLRVDTEFQAGWVRHLTNRWGTATASGLRYYLLDNEWSLTITRKAASLVVAPTRPCNCGATDRRAHFGIRITPTKPGSTTKSGSFRA